MITHRPIFDRLLQLALVSTLTMMMAMLAPGYAGRVLGLSAEDAAYVFWPAGAGMFWQASSLGGLGTVFRGRTLQAPACCDEPGIGRLGLVGGGGDLEYRSFRGDPTSLSAPPPAS